jgi:hypothetical protein
VCVQTLPDEMRSIFGFYHQVAFANPELAEAASPPDVADALGQEAGELEAERKEVQGWIEELRREIASVWEGQKEAEYELVSVFMHRGEASFGHYYVGSSLWSGLESARQLIWMHWTDLYPCAPRPARSMAQVQRYECDGRVSQRGARGHDGVDQQPVLAELCAQGADGCVRDGEEGDCELACQINRSVITRAVQSGR